MIFLALFFIAVGAAGATAVFVKYPSLGGNIKAQLKKLTEDEVA